MANLATSWVITNPSFIEPDLLLQYNQASGAFSALATGNPRIKLGSEDKYVYIRRLDVRTKVSTSQSAANQLPSANVVPSMISTPTYLNRTRAEYDHHDTAMMAEWGTNIVDAQRLAMRQGHFQLLRNMALYGNLPANGEGLLNTNGATAVNLPADSFGATTVRTYDNGQLAVFFITQLSATKTRTMQLGIPHRFVVLGPQRILGQMEYQNIVQLTSYQRAGAGSNSSAGVVKDVAGWNGDTIEWVYDDTLIGAGSGGTDAVLIVMPEVEKPVGKTWNTNDFASLSPGLNACTLMYADVAAPIEIPTPLAGGAIDVLSEMRASPGWGVRPEAITIMSMTY
ncbi:MAG TPA: hypothetical protein VI653_04995 [Steroidobacteraceae bacterium]